MTSRGSSVKALVSKFEHIKEKNAQSNAFVIKRVRDKWAEGSDLEIYHEQVKTWCKGKITGERLDGSVSWLIITYELPSEADGAGDDAKDGGSFTRELKRGNPNLRPSLKRRNQLSAEVGSRLLDAESELERTRAKLKRLETLKGELEETQTQLKAEAEDVAASQSDAQREEVAQLQAELARTTEQLQKEAAEKHMSLSEQVDSLTEELAAATSALEEAQAQISAGEDQESDALAAANSELAAAREQLSARDEELASVRQELDERGSELASSRNELDEARAAAAKSDADWSARLGQTKVEMNQAKDTLTDREDEISKLKAQFLIDLAAANDQLAATQQELSDAKANEEQLSSRVAQLTEVQQELSDAKANEEKLSSRVAQLTDEGASVSARLVVCEATLKDTEQTLGAKTKELIEMKYAGETMEQRAAELATELQRQKDEADSKTKEHEKKEAELLAQKKAAEENAAKLLQFKESAKNLINKQQSKMVEQQQAAADLARKMQQQKDDIKKMGQRVAQQKERAQLAKRLSQTGPSDDLRFAPERLRNISANEKGQELQTMKESLPNPRGWMEKKSPDYFAGWQKRFVLVSEDHGVCWAKEEFGVWDPTNKKTVFNAEDVKNKVPWIAISSVRKITEGKYQRKFQISGRDTITGDMRDYLWKAEDQASRDQWVKDINAWLTYFKTSLAYQLSATTSKTATKTSKSESLKGGESDSDEPQAPKLKLKQVTTQFVMTEGAES